jgi:hypothetical protein
MVHAKDYLGPCILELIMELLGRIHGIAGHAYGPQPEYAEEDWGIMGEVGKKNGYPVTFVHSF